MNKFLLCATLGLVLAATEISAAKNCASITKGKKCKNTGCKWDFQTGAKWKSCSDNVVEDETDAVEDATVVVVVSSCSKFEKKRKCEQKGCDWTKAGKRFKSCNDPALAAPGPSTNATADPTAAAAPTAILEWNTKPGCCRAGGEEVDVLHKESFSGVTATEANSMCANQCVDDLNCTAYEVTKKKKAKKYKKSAPSKFICELHDSEIDSASRSTKSCRASTTTCNIYVSGRCPTAPLPLNDTVFKDAIADCLDVDPVGGKCVNSTYGPMPCWDVSDVTDYSDTFKSQNQFNGKIGRWNTSAGTTFKEMFFAAAAFNQPLNAWATGAAASFKNMFNGAAIFNQELKDWDTGASTTFESMFRGAAAFNQPLNEWDTGASTSFSSMFEYAGVFNQPLNGWNTGASTSFSSMFAGAAAFKQELNAWDTGAATTFAYMFWNAAVFNQPLHEWGTGAATDFGGMFGNAVAFNQPLNGWATGAATSMYSMFSGPNSGASAFNQPLNAWATGNVTTFQYMFQRAAVFNQDISGWDTASITTTFKMFDGATVMLANGCNRMGPPSSCSK